MESNSLPSVVLIGAGRMGRAHLLAANELGITVTAICDKIKQNKNQIGDEFNVPDENRFDDVHKMFSTLENVELVIIATTADSHCDLVVAAAHAGAECILCEKPMATSLADCDVMLEACRKSGTRLAINHQMRFMDQYALVKEEFDKGRFGRLASMNVVAGCFGLSMNGSHYFEAFSYLSGNPIIEITAWFSSDELANPRGLQFFDRAGQIRAVSSQGQRMHIEAGSDQGHGMTVNYALEFGHLFVDELEGVYYATARDHEHQKQPMTRYGMPWTRWEQKFTQADNIMPTKYVINALVHDNNYPSGEDGRRVIAAQVATYKSVANNNMAISLDDLSDYYDNQFPWA